MTVGAKGFIRFGGIALGLLLSSISAHAVSLSIPPLMTAPEMLSQLNQHLIRSKNAPATLDYWCHNYLSPDAELTVTAVKEPTPTLPTEVMAQLHSGAITAPKYLKLQYLCAGKVVAVFEHWYLPKMLPHNVAQQMQQHPISFGRELRKLGYYRQSLSNEPEWLDAGSLPAIVLQQQAVIYRNDKTPFSVVMEHYSRQLLPIAQQLNPY